MIRKPSADLWQYLKSTNKSVLMYGMGNGADKILSVCERHGIEISDFFASDGFVRGHSFHGKRVLSYSEALEKYGRENIIVLLSFATRLDGVLENIYKIADECELYAPDVPVYGNEIFDSEFYCLHKQDIDGAEQLFCDEESKRIYRSIISYKLSGKIKYLRECESKLDEAYREILKAQKFETAADLGAYNGDSIRELLQYSPVLRKVTALEPDRRNHRKLCEYRDTVCGLEIDALNVGAWSEEDTLYFDGSGNRNASIEKNVSDFSQSINARAKKTTEVKVNSLDNILGGNKVDYIKYDVEGSEREALLGSAQTIKKHCPALLVSAYHRSGDIFTLPRLILSLCPDYKLYLRRMKYIPAWDINIYAVKEK